MPPDPAIRTKLSTDFTREEVKRLTMSSLSCRLHYGCFLNWCSFDRRLFNWCSFDRRLFHGRLLNRCFFHGRFFHGCFFDRRFFDWRSFDRRLSNWCVFDWWRFAFNWHLIINRCRFSEILLLRNKTPTANFLEQPRNLYTTSKPQVSTSIQKHHNQKNPSRIVSIQQPTIHPSPTYRSNPHNSPPHIPKPSSRS